MLDPSQKEVLELNLSIIPQLLMSLREKANLAKCNAITGLKLTGEKVFFPKPRSYFRVSFHNWPAKTFSYHLMP